MLVWKGAKESKPKHGDRVLLKIQWEDFPVVGYWGEGRWEVCTANHEVSCSQFCYGGVVEGNFRSDEVTYYAEIGPVPSDLGSEIWDAK